MSDEIQRFLRATTALERLSGRRVAVFGACARAAWTQPRATTDVDVLVVADSPDEITPFASALGLIVDAKEVEALRPAEMTRFRVPEHPSGFVRMDIVVARYPYHRRVVDRAVSVTVFGESIRVARAEDLILLKLLAGRPKDLVDIDDIVLAQQGALDRQLLRGEAETLELDLPDELR